MDLAGYWYGAADLYNVLVAAAARGRSLESVCRHLVGAPTGNLVRQHLAGRLLRRQDLDALEVRCQDLLTARRPADLVRRRQRLAVDLTLVPHYGAPALRPGEVRRGEAKAGTTRFHCYATALVVRDGRRVTLAATFVWAEDELLDVLDELLGRVRRLGMRSERLYLDRGFASVAILQYLHRQPFPSVVALPKRGARSRALLTGRRG